MTPQTPSGQAPLRWGVLGATAYISTLVTPAITRAPGCELVAVASRAGRPPAPEVLGIDSDVHVHDGYAALLADPQVDAVYIALPNSGHVEWTVRALEAGKHVLIEKPMAMDAAGVERVRAAALRASRTVMEAFMYRFHPQQHRAASLLASGEIGELCLIRASFAFRIESGAKNIRLDRALGGGATWDVGCYTIDVAHHFFGEAPQHVRGRTFSRPGLDVETSVVGWMDFGGGRSAVIDYSIDYGPCARYELQGTRGTIAVHNAWAKTGEEGTITVTTPEKVRTEKVHETDHYQLQVEAFTEAVRSGAPAPISLEDSLRTAKTGVALLESAADGGSAVLL